MRETNIHAGHRRNMRRKLLSAGASAFLPHELLEILLYSAIPVSDTNPAAHRLLDRFGSLAALFAEEREALLSVPGIGPRAAELLLLANRTAELAERRYLERCRRPSGEMYDAATELFRFETKDKTYALYLDNACRILSRELILEGRLSAAPSHTKAVLAGAVRAHASMVILATFHSSRVAQATAFEIEASHELRQALELVDVRLVEHFIVSGNYVTPLSAQAPGCLRDNTDLTEYLHRNPTVNAENTADCDAKTALSEEKTLLKACLAYSAKGKASELCEALFRIYHNLDQILSASPAELSRITGEGSAALMSILMPLYRRTAESRFSPHDVLDSAACLAARLAACFVGLRVETVYLLLLDSDYRILHIGPVSSGDVGGAAVEPRRVIELALSYGARYAVLAHNHPAGSPLPSDADIRATRALSSAMSAVGVTLLEHFVFAIGEATPILLYSSDLPLAAPFSFYDSDMLDRVDALRKMQKR